MRDFVIVHEIKVKTLLYLHKYEHVIADQAKLDDKFNVSVDSDNNFIDIIL